VQVLQVLREVVVKPGDRMIMLAGVRYREHLVDPLRAFGCHVEMPMMRLDFGNQLRWLTQHS